MDMKNTDFYFYKKKIEKRLDSKKATQSFSHKKYVHLMLFLKKSKKKIQ